VRIQDIIRKKRGGLALSREEIRFFIAGVTQGYTADYQLSAWAMAVCFQGMTAQETADLTQAMLDSGEVIRFSGLQGKLVDKHSTGGVGDKTTLLLLAIVSALGAPVIKMSGRGLGHTGGTIDKLEAISGFRTELSYEEIIAQANRLQAVIVSQTGNLAPADKKLYAIRDVTATVDCLPLIAASVMSKKLASGAEGIVLDVKVGSGAFMQSIDEAARLAESMVAIGRQAGREMMAFITDMDQPLGCMVGNALEVKEAIDALQGRGPDDLRRLSLQLAAGMLVLNGKFADLESAYQAGEAIIKDGTAYEQFQRIVTEQGGQLQTEATFYGLPQAVNRVQVTAQQTGFIQRLNAWQVGQAAMLLGAGREKTGDRIDPAVGVELLHKAGDQVRAGEPLAVLHYNAAPPEPAVAALEQAYIIGDEKPALPDLIHRLIGGGL
jgi:pyrimidine-nucleoside phosphorylase